MKKLLVFLTLLLTVNAACALASSCTVCGGNGLCDECAGLGYLLARAYGSEETVQIACSSESCDNGTCTACTRPAYESCSICHYDGLCDTCGGLGYLEARAYGSQETVRIACTGGFCSDGACAACSAAPTPQPSAIYYTFKEPVIERALCKDLGKQPGMITYSDLENVEQLIVSAFASDGDMLRTLEDLCVMPKLRTVSISCYGSSGDLSCDGALLPLTALPALYDLTLSGVNVSDVSDLASVTTLEWLRIWRCPLSDIRPLAKLVNLEWLKLNDNQISDLSPIANLKKLKWFTAPNNLITDVTPLGGLTNLEQLDLSGNGITNVSALKNLTLLEKLNLADNGITNANPLKSLPNLEELDLGGNPDTGGDWVPGKKPAYTTSGPGRFNPASTGVSSLSLRNDSDSSGSDDDDADASSSATY